MRGLSRTIRNQNIITKINAFYYYYLLLFKRLSKIVCALMECECVCVLEKLTVYSDFYFDFFRWSFLLNSIELYLLPELPIWLGVQHLFSVKMVLAQHENHLMDLGHLLTRDSNRWYTMLPIATFLSKKRKKKKNISISFFYCCHFETIRKIIVILLKKKRTTSDAMNVFRRFKINSYEKCRISFEWKIVSIVYNTTMFECICTFNRTDILRRLTFI